MFAFETAATTTISTADDFSDVRPASRPSNHAAVAMQVRRLTTGMQSRRRIMRLPLVASTLKYLSSFRNQQVVYLLDEGREDTRKADIRGGKGAGLATLVALGMPVPPGATITTAVAQEYSRRASVPAQLTINLIAALRQIERKSRLRLGSPRRPLLVSVRSGARVSMPGMMDTVLNVGLNDTTVRGLALRAGERFAWDSYRRFLSMFGSTVMGVDKEIFENRIARAKREDGVERDSDLTVERLQRLCESFKRIIENACGAPVPSDPMEQLTMAIFAVLNSWNSPRCVAYRRSENIPDNWGTAVNIQAMVFGNAGENSATGVVFSRNPITGERGLYGEYLVNAQGEDVVAGVRTPTAIANLAEEMPDAYRQLETLAARLEYKFNDMVDIEFTIENGVLYLLQCRAAKRTAEASAAFAVHQVVDGKWNRGTAMSRVKKAELRRLRGEVFEAAALEKAIGSKKKLVVTGAGVSPGSATGVLVFDCEEAVRRQGRGESVILLRHDTSPDDLPGMLASAAIITAVGGSTSHAAVVARGKGIPAVGGAKFRMTTDDEGEVCAEFGTKLLRAGTKLSVDGAGGNVVLGALPLAEPVYTEEVATLLQWADEYSQDASPRPVDPAHLRVSYCLNTKLNDFYLSNLMAEKAVGEALEVEAFRLKNSVEEELAALFTCYLAYAVTTEVTFFLSYGKARNCVAWRTLVAEYGVKERMNEADCRRVVFALAARPMDEQAHYFELCFKVFSAKGWSSSFGGPKWAVIAATGRDWLNGVLPRSVFVDHVFDLRHNGNCMFNKHEMVSSRTTEGTLVTQLNCKKKAVGVYALMTALEKHSSFDQAVLKLYQTGVEGGMWSEAHSLAEAERNAALAWQEAA